MEVRTWGRNQWIVLEEVESGLDRIIEVFRVANFEIVRASFVVANAAEMSHDLTGCD